jgi:hypothetical protein
MILRSCTTWLVPVALTLVGVAIDATKAIAQTTYPFRGNYDTVINITPLTESISLSSELAINTDDQAPYGLTQYQGNVYTQTDPVTGALTFNTDPAVFGLPDLPMGYIEFSGEDTDNKLFGTATATAVLNQENLTGQGFGTLTITGGEGLFANATGVLDFTETDTLNPDPNVLSLNGESVITGSIEVVPEPGAETGILVGGSLGAAILLRRRQRAV